MLRLFAFDGVVGYENPLVAALLHSSLVVTCAARKASSPAQSSSKLWCRTLVLQLLQAVKTQTSGGPVQRHSDSTVTEREFLSLLGLELCCGPEQSEKWMTQNAKSHFCFENENRHAIRCAGVTFLANAFQLHHASPSLRDSVPLIEKFLALVEEHMGGLSLVVDSVLYCIESHVNQPTITVCDTLVSWSAIKNCALSSLALLCTLLCVVNRVEEAAKIVGSYHHRRSDPQSSGSNGALGSLPDTVYSAVLKHSMREELARQGSGLWCKQSPLPAFGVSLLAKMFADDGNEFSRRAAIDKFLRSSARPSLAGDPAVFAWLLHSLCSSLSPHSPTSTTLRDTAIASLSSVVESCDVMSFVASCVPADTPSSSNLGTDGATPSQHRQQVASLLVRSLALVITTVSNLHLEVSALRVQRDSIVKQTCSVARELVQRWQAKEPSTRQVEILGQQKKTSWRKTAAALLTHDRRTHKMELFMDEVPHTEFCGMLTTLLSYGHLAPAVDVFATLLKAKLINLQYFPLPILASLRSATRVLVVDSEDASQIRSAFMQRFLVYGEPLSNSSPLSRSCQQTSAIAVIDNREALIYPMLGAYRERSTVSSFGHVSVQRHQVEKIAWKEVAHAFTSQ